jgi:hypothetical protein
MLRRERIQAMLNKLRGAASPVPPETEHPRS